MIKMIDFIINKIDWWYVIKDYKARKIKEEFRRSFYKRIDKIKLRTNGKKKEKIGLKHQLN
jgi:hypothetical protein